MDAELLQSLQCITPEEQVILDGRTTVDRDIYMTAHENTILCRKLLEAGKLITVRPHTRFIDFPEHRHDYVEMVYMCAGKTTHIVNGKQVTYGLSYELSGTHNVNISDNDFYVGKGSDKRILTVTGTGLSPGIRFEKNVLRQKTYDSQPYSVTGYFKSTNFFGNISFSGNTVTYEGQPTVSDYIFRLSRVFGYKFENNDITLSECTFGSSTDGVAGLVVKSCFDGEAAGTYTVKSEFSSKYVLIRQPDGKETKLVFTKQNTHTIIAAEGGRIELSGDGAGNVLVEVIPDEGYTFTAWQTADGVFIKTGSTKISTPIELKAIFTKN